jgi:N-acyl-D-amino-acid deacylase
MDRLDRPATPAEIAKMRDMARESLASGAIGISTGTAYPPAACAPTEEIVEVCRPLAELGGLYVTHMRNEDDAIVDSMEETFASAASSSSGSSSRTTSASAREPRPLARNARADRENHAQPAVGARLLSLHRVVDVLRYDRSSNHRASSSRGRSRIPSSRALISARSRRRCRCAADAVEKIKPAGAIYFMLDEKDVQRILEFGDTMVGSDGLPHDARPHPRLWGTFPRVLGHYRAT